MRWLTIIKGVRSAIALLILASLSSLCHAQQFPTYGTIQQEFLNGYHVGLLNNSSRIVFEKKPEGWFVRQVEFFPKPHTVKYELYWDAKTAKFNQLSFGSKNSSSGIDSSVQFGSDNSFDFFPFYGYRGWEMDVVNRLDSTLETALDHFTKSLCYASLAQTFIHSDPFVYDGIEKKANTNKELEEGFLGYNKLAEMHLRKALELDSSFQYQEIHIKDQLRLHQIKHALFLGIYFGKTDVLKNLSSSLFTSSELAYYQNILISCPQNSVLFATGDVDVLPLYYLIFNKGKRKDVVLLNRDWIAEKPYQNYLKLIYSDSSIFSSVTSSLFDKQVDFVRVLKYNRIRQRQFPGESLATQKVRMDGLPDNSFQIEDFDLAQEYVELKYLLQFVAEEVNNQMDNGLTRFNYLPTNGIIISTKSSLVRWKIEHKLLDRSDLIFLDVINQNVKNRPICIVSSTPKEMLLDMNDFQLRGLVFELVDDKHAVESSSDRMSISSEILYSNLSHHFNFGDPNSLTDFQYKTYWILFNELVDDLAHRDKFNGALSMVNLFFETFPESSWKDAKTPMLLAEYYYIFQKFDQGNETMKKIHHRILNKNFDGASSMDYLDWADQLTAIVKNYNKESGAVFPTD